MPRLSLAVSACASLKNVSAVCRVLLPVSGDVGAACCYLMMPASGIDHFEHFVGVLLDFIRLRA